MVYIYGELEGVEGVKANPIFKDAIKGASLVYTDDKIIKKNYEAIGVSVKPLTVQKETSKKIDKKVLE